MKYYLLSLALLASCYGVAHASLPPMPGDDELTTEDAVIITRKGAITFVASGQVRPTDVVFAHGILEHRDGVTTFSIPKAKHPTSTLGAGGKR